MSDSDPRGIRRQVRHVRAPAKLNLWLRIFAPDETGYHPLETLFCTTDLADDISITEHEPGISLTVHGADFGDPQKNLAHRAASEFFFATGISPRIHISLHKHIPAGAGLGGGSSDAATVLSILNEQNGQPLPQTDLLAMAARIGSDVPFFLCGSRLAHATGRGEKLSALEPLPRAPAIIVVPPFPVATAEAYSWLDERKHYDVWEADRQTFRYPENWLDVAERATNTFEAVLFPRLPRLQQIRDAIRKTGADIAMLSGSGSALFGIYRDDELCERAGRALRAQIPDAVVIKTLAS